MRLLSGMVVTGRAIRKQAASLFEAVQDLGEYRRSVRRQKAASSNSRVPLRVENLEDRVVPAQIRWNSTISGDWHTPSNWDLGRVPNSLDEVIINVAGSSGVGRPAVTISGPAEAFEVRTHNPLMISGGSLFAGYRIDVIDTESSLTLNNGSIWGYFETKVQSSAFTFTSGTITGDLVVHASTLTLSSQPPAPTSITVTGFCPILSDVPADFTLHALGGTTIKTSSGFTNHGEIILDTYSLNYTSGIRVDGGAFTNAADGVVTARAGSASDPRFVTGRLVNYGQIDVDLGTGLRVASNGSLPARFEQVAGEVSLDGYMEVIGGVGASRFDFVGGQITYVGNQSIERMVVNTVTVSVSGGIAPPSSPTIQVWGTSTLENNQSPLVELRVTNGANLTAVSGAVNAGTIILDSFGNQDCELRIPGEFTNTSTGVIAALVGGGGARRLRGGKLINQGEIWVQAGAGLFFQDWGSDPVVRSAGWGCRPRRVHAGVWRQVRLLRGSSRRGQLHRRAERAPADPGEQSGERVRGGDLAGNGRALGCAYARGEPLPCRHAESWRYGCGHPDSLDRGR